jgi:hypothetical protein
MNWEKAEYDSLDLQAYYLVQTNGKEWRDWDLFVLRGYLIAKQLAPEHVRGRPVWICKIVRPE